MYTGFITIKTKTSKTAHESTNLTCFLNAEVTPGIFIITYVAQVVLALKSSIFGIKDALSTKKRNDPLQV
jgi:hypothetical protein